MRAISRHIGQGMRGQWMVAVSMALIIAGLRPALADIPYSRVAIYYDQPTNTYIRGISYAAALASLVGHYKTTVRIACVNNYSAGQLASCDTVFYIGTYFDNSLPPAFLADINTTTNTVVWLDYNIWKLLWSTNNTSRLGLTYLGHTNGFDAVTYKNDWLFTPSSGTVISMGTNSVPTVLATLTSRVDAARATIPYAIRSSNFWYFADNPFTSARLCDRGLVLADLLHDILGARPVAALRGLARIEDIAPALTSTSGVAQVNAGLTALGVFANYGIIPRYRDPMGQYTNSYPADLPMTRNRPFLRQLRTLVRSGGSLLAHGYTHESGDAVTASGWEFWDHAVDQPLPYDNWAWAEARVTNSTAEFLSAGLPVLGWETPHYTASLVDYPVFATHHRVSHERLYIHSYLTDGMSVSNLDALTTHSTNAVARLLPYPCYRGMMGDRILPENLDRYDPATNSFDANGLAYSISNKVMYAAKFRVVRDAVAGFYYHPSYGAEPLTNLVAQMQALGYVFADPRTLAREEAVPIHTNPVPWEAGAVRTFSATGVTLTADLVVGDRAGANMFQVLQGAAVSNEEAFLGMAASSCDNTALVSGAGSAWVSAQTVFAGYEGARNLAIAASNGTVVAMDTVIGMTSNATGNGIVITGTGSSWSNRYGLTVGQAGPANAAYAINGALLWSQYGEIGATPPASDNYVCVGGTGSQWTVSTYLAAGNGGSGNRFDVCCGGTVESAFGMVGTMHTAYSNQANVYDPGSVWHNTQRLSVGVDGSRNMLSVFQGGRVTCGDLVIGDYDMARSNTVSVSGTGSVLAVSGNMIVGVDGSGNRLLIGNGAVITCTNVIVGQYGTAFDNEIVVEGPGSTLTVSNSTGYGSISILNGRLAVPGGTVNAASVLIGPGGFLETDASSSGGSLNLSGDFRRSATNAPADLLGLSLVFSTPGTHRLDMNSLDMGPSLQGFLRNHALGKVETSGTLIVTNVCYAWSLGGAGTMEIPDGATFYYVDDSGWSGSIIVTGDGRMKKVPVAFRNMEIISDSAPVLEWNSASGLNFRVEWSPDLASTSFLSATNLTGTGDTDRWMDAGDSNRPAPGLATQRFYRLRAWPP